MKLTRFTLLTTLAAAAGLPGLARAEDPPASPLSFNVGVVSDYRYRGISQSRLKPALQGGLDWSHASGAYLGAWASTIKWIKDGGGDADVEIDLYGGYKGEIVKDSLSYDVGVLTYQYPSNKLKPKAETYELYGALTYGPVTAKYSYATSNLFGFANSKHSGYFDVSASFEIAPGLSLAPHVGYQHVTHNSDFSYTDYSLALNYEAAKGLVLSATAVGTSTKKISGEHAYHTPAGKDLGKAGVVAGLKYSF